MRLMRIKNLWCLLFCLSACSSSVQEQIKEPNVAGLWYPAERAALENILVSLNVQAEKKFGMDIASDTIRALIVPHAGYFYSGVEAAAAYRLIQQDSFDRVIVLGPSHFMPFRGVALPPYTQYAIPSGRVDIDTSAVHSLLKASSLYQYSQEAFAREHSIESQLPFIHSVLPHALVVPLLVGDLSVSDINTIATTIRTLITPKTLVVVSSDFTHYGTRFGYTPFKDSVLLRVKQLDSSMLYALQQADANAFSTILKQTGATVCGRGPINILLQMMKQNAWGTVHVQLVAYGTSADVSPDMDGVVTYGSLVVTIEKEHGITMQEKNSLLQYAGDLLLHSFDTTGDADLLKPIMTPLLQQPRGVFVTLYTKNGTQKQLRGCIGTVIAREPLYKGVADMARAAAFHDSRFSPLTRDELDTLMIEISLLTVPRPVASYRDIILNKHGIILTVGAASALFLPKVPKEYGFTLEQTLKELSKKAGLSENAWQRPDATFQIFEAIDFMH
jgi:MEMO1 family protein